MSAESHAIDVPEADDKSPLMVACLKGKEHDVRYLLAKGSDPNSRSKDGNTPMHYACTLEAIADEYVFKLRMNSKLRIVKMLFNSGAVAFKNNLDGWSAPCLASLYRLDKILEFFMSMDEIPLEVKAKVRGITIVSLVLNLPHPLEGFSQALPLYQGTNLQIDQNPKSAIVDLFSRIFKMEFDIKDKIIDEFKRSVINLKVHVFPEHLKQKYIYPRLVRFGVYLILEKHMYEEGFQVLSYAINLEGQGRLQLGSVAANLTEVCLKLREKSKIHLRQPTNDLLWSYESALCQIPLNCLFTNIGHLVKNLGVVLFCVALQCSDAQEHSLKSTLGAIEKSMKIVQHRMLTSGTNKNPNVPSVLFQLMKRLNKKSTKSYIEIGSKVRNLNRIKYAILKLLFFDNVSYQDQSGQNILHLLSNCVTPRNVDILDTGGAKNLKYLQDLGMAFIRHGCPVNDKNDHGLTARDNLNVRHTQYFEVDFDEDEWHWDFDVDEWHWDFDAIPFLEMATDLDQILPREDWNVNRAFFAQTARVLDPTLVNTFQTLLDPTPCVIRLEELSARTILKFKVKYHGLPSRLCKVIQGESMDFDFNKSV